MAGNQQFYDDDISALMGGAETPREMAMAEALRRQRMTGDAIAGMSDPQSAALGRSIGALSTTGAQQYGQIQQAGREMASRENEGRLGREHTSAENVLTRAGNESLAAQQQGHELIKQSQRFQGEAGLQLTSHEQNLVTGAIDNGYKKAMKILDFDQSKATAAQRQEYDKELRNMIQTFTTAERKSAQKYSSSENSLDRDQTMAISLMRDALENKRIGLQKTVQEHGMSSTDSKRLEYLKNREIELSEESGYIYDSSRLNSIQDEISELENRKPSRWEQLKSAF